MMTEHDPIESVTAGAAQHTRFPQQDLESSPPSAFLGSSYARSLWLAVSSFPAVLIALLTTVEFFMLRGGMADPDIWWHLRNAQYLFLQHQLPRHDTFSFTVAGHPWINHEWLAEIPYYLGWRAFGLSGVEIVEFLVIASIFWGVLYLCYQESGNIKASLAACAVSILLSTVSFGPRTILFGYALMVLMLILLQRFRKLGRAPLWCMPPLFCLWANTHGSWLMGLVIFAIVVLAGIPTGRWGRIVAVPWTPSQLRRLSLAWLASVAALFVNPFTYRLVLYPFDLAFRQKLNIAHVSEWVSVNFHDTRGKLVLALLIGLLLSALVRKTNWSLAEVGLLLFGLYSGLTYIRFLFLLGILVAPIIARSLDFFPPYRPEMETRTTNIVFILLMAGVMFHFRPTADHAQETIAQQYPVGASAYLRSHPPQGPMLNFYLWGGFLGWNDNGLKVFVDSRVDMFEYAGVLKDYLDIAALKGSDGLLRKYRTRYVLFPPAEPLTYVLERDSSWSVAYRDEVSVLFERNDATLASAGRRDSAFR